MMPNFIDKPFRRYENFYKSQGEGSHGGKVIGHTKSGKPIYGTANHPSHSGFNSMEHKEAGKLHHGIMTKMIGEGGGNKALLNHHGQQSMAHLNSAIRTGQAEDLARRRS